MRNHLFSSLFLIACTIALLGSVSACGEDAHDADVHLQWLTTPETTMTAGASADVTWMVHTEGDLHHTEIRACMGENAECGLGGMESYDESFMATPDGDNFNASISLEVLGTWSVVVYAHVGEDPAISEVTYVTVE